MSQSQTVWEFEFDFEVWVMPISNYYSIDNTIMNHFFVSYGIISFRITIEFENLIIFIWSVISLQIQKQVDDICERVS